jgi:hemoglobin
MLKKSTKGLAILLLAITGLSAQAEETQTTLYERLGEWDGIGRIVRDTIANHQNNPAISHYFEGVDAEKLAGHVTAFFAAGSGGPSKYAGRDMTTTHANMGLTDADFDTAVADVMKAVEKNGIDDTSAAEVAAILESLRPAVMGTGDSG